MDSSWYQQQADPYANQSSPTQDATSSTSYSNPVSDFQEAQRVLNSYPFASATPASSHGRYFLFIQIQFSPYSMFTVTRHLDNLTMSAPIPSYIQHQYYSHQPNPPLYAEYTDLAAPILPPPGPRRQYWEESRDDATRLLVPESEGYCHDHYLYMHHC